MDVNRSNTMKTNGTKPAENGQKTASHKVDIDDLDKSILRHLQEDGKASLRDLAEKLGSSVSTIKNHVDRLNDQGVIKHTIAVLDCCKVGYREMLLMSIRISTSRSIQEIFTDLEKIETINAIYQVSGAYPIFCMAKCVEKEDEISLLEMVKKVQGVEEIVTQIVLQRHKEDFRINIP